VKWEPELDVKIEQMGETMRSCTFRRQWLPIQGMTYHLCKTQVIPISCYAWQFQSRVILVVQIFCQALQVHDAAQKKSSNGMPPDRATILMNTAGQCSKIHSERPVESQFDQFLLTSALIDRKREQLNQNCNTY